jgi:ketosteroid isomerase-like protein
MNAQERHGSEIDLRAIDRVRDAHVAALNSGNGDAWVAQFTEDGVQMPPNAPANMGVTMIGSCALLSHFQVEFALAIDEVRVSGDWAFERGGYTIGMNAAADGLAMQDSGKYITIYQKSPAGTWRMARDIWNSNNPAD